MPNRLIKESIRTSKTVNEMNDFQFRLWSYLITYVDDYGRGIADPEIIKGFVMPRRKNISEKDITKALKDLEKIGALILYTNDGDDYLAFPNWDKHQTIRNKKSKYPAPTDEDKLKSIASNCSQDISFESECARNPIQSNPNPNPESNPNICTEHESSVQVISITLNDGSEYPITQSDIDYYQELYPAVNVLQEMKKMKGWSHDNPKKRKTKSGITRFIGSWLSREQDKYHGYQQRQQTQPDTTNPFLQMLMENREEEGDEQQGNYSDTGSS